MLSIKSLLDFSLIASAEILIGGFITYYVGWIIYSRFLHPYHDIPGPFAASITQWWYFRAIRYGIGEDTQLPIHKKYGKFVRIGPNDVSISDATAIATVYGNNPLFRKTEWYSAFSPKINGRTDTFTELDEKIHTAETKKIASIYTPGQLLQYEPCVDRVIDLFCQAMEDFAASKEVVDISVWFRKYTFDVIGEMFYGKEGGFGFIKDNKDVNNWMGMLDRMVPIVSSLGYVPYGMQTLYVMVNLALFSEVRNGLGSAELVKQQAQATVKERRQELESGTVKPRNDVLQKLMNIVRDRGEKIDYNYDDVATSVWTMIWAGSDTTGYAISGIFYHTLRTPKAYKKLVDEVQEAFANGTMSFPIRYNDARKLPYLNACIQEGIRFSPVSGTGLPRYVPKGGATIAGRYFPEGYKVIMNSNAVHFDKDCFGEDAEEFVPERWLRESDEKTAYMARHVITFGWGKRRCLGENISQIEMYKLIPAILHKFEFELTVPEWNVKNCWFRCPSNLNVKVKSR